jgi:acyl-coenzyme A synthetase/AMP-(fatty) acid ligase
MHIKIISKQMKITIPHQLELTSNTMPNKVALVDKNISLTFLEFYQLSISAAYSLKKMGIKKGDRVGVCMEKNTDQTISIMAVLFSDAILVPILPKLKDENIKHIVNDCSMCAIITDHVRYDEVKEISSDLKIIGCEDIKNVTEKKIKNDFSLSTSDLAAIIYSSGSTGRPKGITITHQNIYDGARIVSEYLSTNEQDRISGVLSFNFDYGLNQLWQIILKGATLYLHDFIFPNDFFMHISENKITAIPIMPVIISKMFDRRFYTENSSLDFSSVRYVSTSGGRLSSGMINDLTRAFKSAKIFSMYGLTEAFRSTFLDPEQIKIRPTSIGKAIPDVEIFVLNDNKQLCKPNEVGELVHRGACISKGYWGSPKKTAERFKVIDMFPNETVVFSGDLVKTDEDGFLYFISRKDSMIKTQGYRVSPTEVEEEVNKHEKITTSVVFGRDNIDVGQDIILIYTTSDKKELSKKLLLHYLKEKLPSYMVPKYIYYNDEFPITGNEGKIDKQSIINSHNKILN